MNARADYLSLSKLLKSFRSAEFPVWYKLLNLLSLLPSLAWPLVFFGSIFIFDNPSNFRYALFLFFLINCYPLFLLALVSASFRLFNSRRNAAVAIPAALLFAFSVFILRFFF